MLIYSVPDLQWKQARINQIYPDLYCQVYIDRVSWGCHPKFDFGQNLPKREKSWSICKALLNGIWDDNTE